MSAILFLQQIVNGLLDGVYYLLIALGLSLIFSLGGVVNLAHGAFFAIGAYLTLVLSPYIGFGGSLAVAPALVGILGIVIERTLFRRFYRSDPILSLLLTFGLAMVAVLWAYDGWSDVAYVGGEVKDPQRTLPRAFFFGASMVAVLYLAVHDAGPVARLVEMFTAAFGQGTLVETVPVPRFHYGGALIVVDLFCAPSEPVIEEDLPGGGHARVKRESGLILMNLTAPVDTLGQATGGLLTKHALSPHQLLSGWGIAPEFALSAVPGQIAPRLPGFFAGALMPCYNLFDKVNLYLTFGEGNVDITESR